MRVGPDPEPVEPSGPAAVGVLRAWIEGDPPMDLRVKVIAAPLEDGAETTDLGTVTTIDDACALLAEWLERFAATHRPLPRLGVLPPPNGPTPG